MLVELRPRRSAGAAVHPLPPAPVAHPSWQHGFGVLVDRCGAGGGVRVHVNGELDLATSPRLELTLQRLVAAQRSVVLDLDRVSFMDASGIGVILRTAALARELQRRFTVARSPGPCVRRLLAVSGVEPLVPWDA
ncbi:MAG: anti-sigma factor antagonist [Solirubrobacteraceae bacterium]|nr:anti-sigma factor antagonist [Solirubrobacteraceae bacterium]